MSGSSTDNSNYLVCERYAADNGWVSTTPPTPYLPQAPQQNPNTICLHSDCALPPQRQLPKRKHLPLRTHQPLSQYPNRHFHVPGNISTRNDHSIRTSHSRDANVHEENIYGLQSHHQSLLITHLTNGSGVQRRLLCHPSHVYHLEQDKKIPFILIFLTRKTMDFSHPIAPIPRQATLPIVKKLLLTI